MALIRCPECNKEISDKADACPHCGFPITSPKNNAPTPMTWLSEKNGFIVIECPQCNKISRINKSKTQTTSTGYRLNGKGTCSCSTTFNEIYRDPNKKSRQLGFREKSKGFSFNYKIICPHCQNKGSVITRQTKKKKGISGAKATGALLTAGLSIFATGLSRKEYITEACCKNFGAKWDF